ncbi:hypothetical protein CI109_103894 [Kwoniella shandongensis]|uniref:Uncharacterized protein n=1 Tax=Kwoniella shandongensis TaxID=1734106 RepID=A0A5M6BT66_9TREE|nr:uncharacterized protein CI109_005652 [Kwoniella shandongensis]KAA5526056.1 hypothetical protein CI109_005652 [Kwoniella shandongensis]
MKVFLTGANGRVGSHVLRHLLARGHSVTGLVRTPEGASYITSLVKNDPNFTTIVGDLSNHDLLVSNAKLHDGTIHCAMEHRSNPAQAAAHEREIVQLIGNALEGTGKSFIISGVVAPIGGNGDEQTEPTLGRIPRATTDVEVRELKNKGVRSATVRLASVTHNKESIHPFLGSMIAAANKLGYIPYASEDNYWTAGHADDAGLLFVLVLEKGQPGVAVHEIQEKVKVKDIAELLARKTGKTAGKIPTERLSELGFIGNFLGSDQTHLSSEWTKKTFGWEPKGQTLLDELEKAPKEYFEGAAFPS